MDIINVSAACDKSMGNTGYGQCWNDLGIWRGIIFGPTGVDIDASTIETVKTYLEQGILNDVGSLRVRPLQDVIEVTPSGADPITFTETTTQRTRITADGYQQYIVRYSDGGFCLSNRLRQAKSMNVGFMVIMDNGKLQCYASPNPGKVRFIPGDFYALPALPPTQPSEAPSYRFQLTVAPEDVNEGSAIIDFNGAGGIGYLKGLMGLQDVTLYQTAARAQGVLNIGAKSACGSVDMFDIYADELEDEGLWKFTNAATGANIPITSAVKSTVYKGWVVTLNPNTYALPGYIEWAGPTELEIGGVPGFESNKLLV